MNLSDLISKFTKQTGRLDLSSSDISTLLNESCQLLDHLENSGKRMYRYLLHVPAGETVVNLEDAIRVVGPVSLHTATDVFILERQGPETIRDLVKSNCSTDIYCYTILSDMITSIDFADLPETVSGNAAQISTSATDRGSAIQIYPAQTDISTLEFYSSSYSLNLASGVNLENYWTSRVPNLVLDGANYLLLKNLLNADEAAKVLKDLTNRIAPMTFDLYEQEDINQMEG